VHPRPLSDAFGGFVTMLSPEERRLVAQMSLGAPPSVLFLRPIFRVGETPSSASVSIHSLRCVRVNPGDVAEALTLLCRHRADPCSHRWNGRQRRDSVEVELGRARRPAYSAFRPHRIASALRFNGFLRSPIGSRPSPATPRDRWVADASCSGRSRSSRHSGTRKNSNPTFPG